MHNMRFKYLIANLIYVTCVLIFTYKILYNSKEFQIRWRGGLGSLYKSKIEFKNLTVKCNISDTNLKYILQWTPGTHSPFYFLGSSQEVFIKKKCEYNNCFVSEDRNLLNHHTCYHAVLFNGHEVINLPPEDLPRLRSTKQKYIFAAMESAHNYPACNSHLDGFFNWTWTYRLDSEARWGYVTAYDMKGGIVAPKPSVAWPKLQSTDGDTSKLLMRKSKAVAWFVSNCKTLSGRDIYAYLVSKELSRFGFQVDIFGQCGRNKCLRYSTECARLLRDQYFFYFAFENSIADDYVTEKVLIALNNLVVPVVYGGANYSRFLPPGSYLNARDYDPVNLAQSMMSIMKNKSAYQEYFKWRNHFYYKETSDNQDICSLCALLNDDKKFNKFSVYEHFREWWYPNFKESCHL